MAAGVAEAIVSGVASKVAESLFDPIRREISYAFKYQNYVEKLKSPLEDLKNKKQRVEQAVNKAKRQGGEIYGDVQPWIDQTTELIERADILIKKYDDVANNKRCFKGLCPNLMSRRKLSKEAVNAGNVANDLLRKGNDTNVSYLPPPERTELMNDVTGYQQFDSRMKIFQDVMEVLNQVGRIGVYGMGGVGKTTLVKQVAKKVMEEKLLFDEVAMVEVTLNPDLETIQDKIAYDIGFSFPQDESALYARADRLRQRLKEKRVLVILDNIWAKLDLEAVGIPSGVHDHRQCTVLLTSRNRHVLCNDMNSQKTFSIEVLSDEESLGLFRKTGGDHDSTQTSDFQTLAVEVVRKCGGLPIAIKTVAVALKNKSLSVWKDALNQLRNSNPRHIRGMEKNVYSSIKLSYDLLEIEETKSLFRLCALQNDGSQIPINDLMIYGMGLDWFRNVCSLEEGRNRVHALIDNLKTSCLLLDGDSEHVVKMHDVIHSVAVSIAAEEHMFNIQDVADLKEELEKVMEKDPTAISLPYREIQELPERMECPKLELFLLFAKSKLEGNYLQISDLFFEGMKELRVLHLTRICFLSISSSLGCLTNLRTLSLNYFDSLEDVAIIGKLTKLQILSFRNSNIKQLPLEIGQLTRLKLLDLSNCRSLEVIAPNVISGSKEIVAEDDREDLMTVLFNNKVIFPALEKLELCSINVEKIWLDPFSTMSPSSYQNLTELTVVSCSRLQFLFTYSMVKSLVRLQKLEIEHCESMERVIDTTGLSRDEEQMIDLEVFPKLEYLELWNLPKLARFMSTSSSDSEENNILHTGTHSTFFDKKVIFPALEKLELQSINVEKIWLDPLSTMSTSPCQNLTELKVVNSSRLKFLLTYSMVSSLVKLQKLEIERCESMERIIDTTELGRDEEQMIDLEVFPKLEYLKLNHLPKLARFVSMSSSDSEENNILHTGTQSTLFDKKHHQFTRDSFSKLKELDVFDCDKVEMLFGSLKLLGPKTDGQHPVLLFDLDKVRLPSLEKLSIGRMGNLRKIWQWHPQLTWDSFSKLKELNVSSCHKLTSVFSFNIIMGRKFERLEVLKVECCESIEEIIEEETSSNSSSRRVAVFSQLINLQLLYMQKLKSIYQGIHILEWSALKDLYVKGCHKVEILFASSELLESQQPIILVDHHKVVFPNLKTLKVNGCDGLRNLMTLSTAESQVKLARMGISDCKMIEKIIEMQVGGVKEDPIVFTQLEYLRLHNLPTLESFCLENYTLKFPYLEQVIMSLCPSMKTFSQGVLDTPILHKVKLGIEDKRREKPWELRWVLQEGRWELREERLEGNLNSTVRKLFQGMDLFSGINDLKLSNFPSLKEIWDGNAHALPVSFFSNLTSLVVDDCTFMLSAIPANLLRFLNNLRHLEVRNCDSVEEVFHLEDLNAGEVKAFLNVRGFQLNELKLVDLPKLKRCCNYNGNKIVVRIIIRLWIENCPNMETFISNSTPAHMTANIESQEMTSEENFLTDIQPFFDEKVDFFDYFNCLELKLFKLPKLLHLWKENSHSSNGFKYIRRLEISECHKLRQLIPSSVTFECLTTLEVSKCDGLINLVTLSTAKSLSNLTRMNVYDCKMIEEIIQQVGKEAEEDCIVFGELKYLGLSCLPSLTSFCLGNYTLEFPSLEHVFVKECPKMEIFSRGLLRTPKFQNLRLTELDSEEEVESDSEEEERWEGSLNFAIQKLFQEMNSKEEN